MSNTNELPGQNISPDLAALQKKIDDLKQSKINPTLIKSLEDEYKEKAKAFYSQLTAKQYVQIARHPDRPHSLDYIRMIFDDFQELAGDRHTGNCEAIVGGIATLNNSMSVMVIGQEKGRDVKERIKRNFGMPQPEGYRKALRLMKLAEKFNMPIVTLIDTQGAYPGVQAEKNNQSEAIARNLYEMPRLTVPIISVVIGEGSSGGALAIGVADIIAMLEYSVYTTISPEGCASILWKDANKADAAAEAMSLTSFKLKEANLVDAIIPEPLEGAHSDAKYTACNIKKFLTESLHMLQQQSNEQRLEARYEKLMMRHLHAPA